MSSAEYLATLHKNIDRYFNLEEVKTLYFRIGGDSENIEGEARSVFIRNLIVQLAKQNRLQDLVALVRSERPFMPWPDVPADFELPESVAKEDIRQVVNYTIYGNQYNVSDNAQVGQIGNTINTGGGEYVAGNKTVHGDDIKGTKIEGDNVQGDQITTGDISDSQGLALGRDASAQVHQSDRATSNDNAALAAKMGTAVQQAVEQVELYANIAKTKNPQIAGELSESIRIILLVAQESPPDPIHLKLLLLGQKKLVKQLVDSTPGIEQVVGAFETAVT
ncbi:MAG: hypothetical protein AAF490_15600 [Chloroflexota bacterium]